MRKKRQFKLVYKIILTLFLINIVPLMVVNLILTSQVDAILQATIRRSLQEGRDYINSIFINGMREIRSEAKSLSEEKRFFAIARKIQYGRQTGVERAGLGELMTEFNVPYLALYQADGTTGKYRILHSQSFSHFQKELISLEPGFLARASREGGATVSISKKGLIFLSAMPLQIDAARSRISKTTHILLIARVRELSFLNQLRVALRKDFTLINAAKKATLSTRYNAWGESLQDKKIDEPHILSVFRSRKEQYFRETHLSRKQAALAFPVIDPGTGSILTVGMVSQERAYTEEQQSIFLFLQLITLISVALTIIVSVFLSRGIVGPVNHLIKGIKRLSDQIKKDENYRPIILKTRDEILTLAKAYNTMAADLFTSHKELKEYSGKLEEKVEQRTRKLNETNKRMKQDLEIARTVQMGILPRVMPVNEDFAIAAWMTPMLETSGDYYDIIEIDEQTTGLLVVDVSGHGIPSALVTMMAKTSFSNYAKRPELATGEICRLVNQAIHTILGDIGFYLTAFFVKVNTRTMEMEFTNAGHHKAIRFNTDTEVLDELDSEGFFIGSIEDAAYETKRVQLHQHDRVLIFTDGIVEARDHSGDFFGEDRLFDFIREHKQDTARDFVDKLIAAVDVFYKEASPNDDRTALVFDVFKTHGAKLDIAGNTSKEIRENFKEGTALIRSGDYAAAEGVFRNIISFDPGNATAWFNLGIVHYRRGQLEQALNSWEKTLGIDPGFTKAKDNLIALRKIMQQDPSG